MSLPQVLSTTRWGRRTVVMIVRRVSKIRHGTKNHFWKDGPVKRNTWPGSAFGFGNTVRRGVCAFVQTDQRATVCGFRESSVLTIRILRFCLVWRDYFPLVLCRISANCITVSFDSRFGHMYWLKPLQLVTSSADSIALVAVQNFVCNPLTRVTCLNSFCTLLPSLSTYTPMLQHALNDSTARNSSTKRPKLQLSIAFATDHHQLTSTTDSNLVHNG